MNVQRLAFVITSINATSPGMVKIGERAQAQGNQAIMVGDRKGPTSCQIQGITYYSLEEQRESGFRTAIEGPVDTYTRKLTGYLIAISSGVDFIRETDDDNTPYDSFFASVPDMVELKKFTIDNRWANICAAFTDRHVWPRGFPLSQIHNPGATIVNWSEEVDSYPSTHLVLQSLADGDPDVDAVFRLTAADTSEIIFRQDVPVQVPHGTWTPFNSQATTWPRRLFPLMYLPATCSFRMTDIWRSFVTQRVLRELDSHVAYTAPNVYQDRNDHNLMKDFADEIEGYLGYEKLIDLLESIQLESGTTQIGSNLIRIYQEMASHGFVAEGELLLLDAWLADLTSLGIDL